MSYPPYFIINQILCYASIIIISQGLFNDEYVVKDKMARHHLIAPCYSFTNKRRLYDSNLSFIKAFTNSNLDIVENQCRRWYKIYRMKISTCTRIQWLQSPLALHPISHYLLSSFNVLPRSASPKVFLQQPWSIIETEMHQRKWFLPWECHGKSKRLIASLGL